MKIIFPAGTRGHAQMLFFSVSFVVFGIIFGLLSFVPLAEAVSPPSVITYQGKLLEDGAVVETAKAMMFTIYDASSGGTLLYTAGGSIASPSTVSVTPTSGLFSIDLGGAGTHAITPDIFANNTSLYLEVTIEGDTLSPRKLITAAPFALNSEYLRGIAATTTSSSTYIPVSDSSGNFSFNLKATSTMAVPLTVFASDGGKMLSISSSTLNALSDADSEQTRSQVAVLSLGSETGSGLAGALLLRAVSGVTGGLVIQRTASAIGAQLTPNGLMITDNGTTTSTLTNSIFALGQTTSAQGGLFSVNSNGSVSASGTLQTYGLASLQGGFLSIASSTVNGTLRITGTTTITDSLRVEGKSINPTHRATLLHNAGGAIISSPEKIVVRGHYAYITSNAGSSGLEIVDISTSTHPTHVGSLPDNASIPLGSPKGIAVSGNYAYIAASTDNAFVVVDISIPSAPRYVAALFDGVDGAKLQGPRNVAVVGNYAYVAALTSDALEIIDISDPYNPRHVGAIDTTSGASLDGAYGVAVSGNYAYVASLGSSALEIIDISDPKNPRHVSALAHGSGNAALNQASNVTVAGRYAYVAAYGALEIVDISNPNAPSHVGSFLSGIANNMWDVAVAGSLVYVTDLGNNSLRVIDSSNPAAPVLKGMITHGTGGAVLSNPSGLAVMGNYAYVISSGALEIIDISGAIIHAADIGSARIGSLQTLNDAFFDQNVMIRGGVSVGGGGLSVSGDFSLMSATTSAFGALSATNTLRFSHTTLFETSVTGTDSLAFLFNTKNTLPTTSTLFGIQNNGVNRLVVTGEGNVGINSSTPNAALAVSGTVRITGTTTVGNLLAVEGRALDVRIKTATSSVHVGPTVAMSGSYAYTVSAHTDSLTIIDMASSTPQFVGSATNGVSGISLANPQAIAVAGAYAYVLLNTGQLTILDVSDPTSIIQRGSVTTNAGYAILVSGNYAYLSGYRGDVSIVDISNPSRPVEVGTYENVFSDTYGSAMALNNSYLYVSMVYDGVGGGSLMVIDVRDPGNPRLTSTFTDPVYINNITSMAVAGSVLYVATASDYDGSLRFTSFDIRNPRSLHVLSSVSSVNGYSAMAVNGSYAYLSQNTNAASAGIEVYDISDPSRLRLVRTLPTSYYFFTQLRVIGNDLFGMTTNSGVSTLVTFDVSGATISNATIGSLKTGAVFASEQAQFDQNVFIRGGLQVGRTGLLLSGDFSMSVPSSTASVNATNTLRFSHTALFLSTATSTDNHLFVFDTASRYTFANSSTYVFSVRNQGLKLFSVSSNGDIAVSSTVFANSATIGTPGTPGDVAERVDVNASDPVGPGDVLVVDHTQNDTYRRSSESYTPTVAGVVSTDPSIIVGNGKTSATAVMALIGRVPVKVTNENGAISRGDRLVSASLPGHAMKYDPEIHDGPVGIIGIALEPFTDAQGRILVLLQTTVAGGSITTLSVTQNAVGQLVSTDFNGETIVNVAAIRGLNNRWKIAADGRFTSVVDTAEGPVEFAAVRSTDTEFVLSGSDQLVNGQKRIDLAAYVRDLVSDPKLMKISLALTSESAPIFVSQKDATGFTVKEMNSGQGTGTFDWILVLPKKEILVPPVEPPAIPSETEATSLPEQVESVSPLSSEVLEAVEPVVETPEPTIESPEPVVPAEAETPSVETDTPPAIEESPTLIE